MLYTTLLKIVLYVIIVILLSGKSMVRYTRDRKRLAEAVAKE